jgi:hypothetical protein
MISKAEREHILVLKRWSIDARAALRAVQLEQPLLGKLITKIMPTTAEQETIFDNVDWLIALMERELHTQGVKSLLAVVEKHEAQR